MSVAQPLFRIALLDANQPTPTGLSDGHGGSAEKRFAVYRNNVASSLTEALVLAFPTIHSLVGDDFFRALAAVFLRQHPPTSPLLMFYGAEMPGFLASFEPVQHLPYLPDCARIDLAMRRSYHSADAPAVTAEALGAVAPDALGETQVSVAPSVEIITSLYPIHSIWKITRGGAKPQAVAEDVLISRPAFDPMVDVLAPGGADFLTALQQGATLNAALEAAQNTHPDFDLGGLLGLALQRGVFTDLTPPNQD